MTGFARVRRTLSSTDSTLGSIDAVVSLKTVNHKGLDLHFHMPFALDPFEATARAEIRSRVARGHIQLHIALERQDSPSAESILNVKALEQWKLAFQEAARILGSDRQPDPHEALRAAGMLQRSENAPEWSPDLEEALSLCLNEALEELNAFREREGAAIAAEMIDRADAVMGICAGMERIRATAAEAFHQRLRERLAELLRDISLEPQRLAQEAAILAERSDISEELMRLTTHAHEVCILLNAAGEKGKKLDFLLQEMNRESNTILSKTGGLVNQGLLLTDFALKAKAEIDKMREQALNLE